MSWFLLHCLKQTELKYGGALVYSDGLSKHGILLMWKITEMRKICPFFFSKKFCITPFMNSLLQNITVGSLVYSEPDFVKLNSARGWITNSGSPCDSSTTLQDGIMLSPHQTISCLASSERHTSASQFPLFYFKTLILSFSMLLFHSVPCLTPWKLATVIPVNFFKLFYCTNAMV